MDQRSVADRARIYGEAYEARQRDPVVDIANRASVANGRMSRWERFNRGQELIYVHDAEEKPRALTPKQYEVYQLAVSMVDGPMHTMRDMASLLHVAPSTVSRALAKLQAWGILVYIVGRGRWAGLVIVRYVKRYEYLRKAAKERIRRWSEAANRRLSRLAFNVAPYIHGGQERVLEVVTNPYLSSSTKGATLTAQRRWTPEELRDVGII